MNPLPLLELGILFYFLAMNGYQLTFLARSYFAMRRYMNSVDWDEMETLFGTQHYKPISLLCPVYNEAAGVVGSVSSLLALRYPETQVIVVNDGSTDDSLELLIEAFKLRPSHRVVRKGIATKPVRNVYESLYVLNLVVVDKENGGKADALNCALNLARYPLVCCMDGDSLLENDALLRAVRPFLDTPNTMACSGVIRPLNGCHVTPNGIRGIFLPKNWLPRFQIVEYLRAFLYGRVGLASFKMLFIVSGAFGIFRRDLLEEIGGFKTSTVGEDFEAILRLHRHLREKRQPFNIAMVPDPICWTEVPEHFKTLRRQRNRWQRGLMETLWSHRRLFLNPRYGSLGLISMPFFVTFEALGPMVELTGYALFAWQLFQGGIDLPFASLFLLVAIFLGLLNSIAAVLLEVNGGHRYQGLKAFLLLLLTAILENFGYRQLTVFWRLTGIVDFLRGRSGWGRMQRTGAASGAGTV